MTLWWMIYLAAASVPVVAGTWLIARVLRRHGRPERGAWALGLALAIALPVGLLVSGTLADFRPVADAVPTGDGGAISLPALTVSPRVDAPALPQALQLPFWLMWGGGSLLMCGWLGASLIGLRRIREGSRPAMVHGRPVRVSPEMGPAVVGFVRPEILLPEWVLDVSDDESHWIIRHEEEHLMAGDPLLLLLGQAARVLMPWNPMVWLVSDQLFRAIEIDCDRRVLRGTRNPASYGETLLSAALRQPDPLVRPVAAFALLSSDLERRLQAMSLRSRTFGPAGALSLIAGLALTIAACGIPLPTDLNGPAPELNNHADVADAAPSTTPADVEVQDMSVVSSPRFTPYEVAPVITNLRVVQQELVDNYPPLLRDAGIGGTATVYFFIDEEGVVRETRINQSSGHAELDEAALSVASVMQFTPARNRDEAVAVWVSFPIVFGQR